MKKITKSKKKSNKFNKKIPNRIFISKVKIDNIKAFKEDNEIALAPMINLVFGKNSSGKSTINQSLRLFRQSYGLDKLTPFNYEAPQELRGKGGLDFSDVGYEGLVNNGDIKKKISLGVETGIYLVEEKKISNNKKSINYTYKFKKNFYSGKNLVKAKTVLDKVYYSNRGGDVLVELPKHVFFKDTSKFGDDLGFRYRIKSGELFISRGQDKTVNDSIYSSVYDPYYYKTNFKPENLNIKFIDEAFEKLKDQKFENIKKFYSSFLKFLENKKEIKKNLIGDRPANFELHSLKMRPLAKKVHEIRVKNEENLNNQLNELLEISETTFRVYEDEFLDFTADLNDLKKDKLRLIKDIKKLILFFSDIKNKDEFVNFFKKDICLKNKNIIFFKGYFMAYPTSKDMNKKIFSSKDHDEYLINIVSWLIGGKIKSTVDIFNGYTPPRFGPHSDSSLEDITKAMNKFVVAPGLRQIPKRYFVKGLQTDYVGPSAENLGELLQNPEINKATNKWFQKLEIPYNVDVRKSGNYYEIIFLPKNSKIKISSMHIGLGYPLILPFIVQCIIAKNKIILIEEPEVHLHPKLEADLADLIVESSLIRSNQFIIETHSEDFLLRILKSIRLGKLKPEDVSVNYIVPNDKSGSKATRIDINKFGQYTTPWNDNLFAERRREFSNKK